MSMWSLLIKLPEPHRGGSTLTTTTQPNLIPFKVPASRHQDWIKFLPLIHLPLPLTHYPLH